MPTHPSVPPTHVLAGAEVSARCHLDVGNEVGSTVAPSDAADLVKTTMLRLQTALPTEAVLIAQIHDELIVECREDDAEDAANIMRVEMTKPVPQLPVALAVKDRRWNVLGGGHSGAAMNRLVPIKDQEQMTAKGRYCRIAATIATLLRCVRRVCQVAIVPCASFCNDAHDHRVPACVCGPLKRWPRR
jgi:hypothetical protein